MRLRSSLRARGGTGFAVVGCALAVLLLLPRTGRVQSVALPWANYAHDVHHTAISTVASMPLLRIRWAMPVDLTNPSGEILIHYGSPLVTAANTVLVPVRTSSANTFRMEARNGTNGALLWMQNTDYVLPPHDWTPPFTGVLAPQPNPPHMRLYYQGIGGTVHYIDNPDTATNATVPTQIAFYGAHTADFDNKVFINTPITADRYGNIYFGFQVTSQTLLGAGFTSGLARINYQGVGTWVTARAAAGDAGITKLAHNCAPALSNDQRTVYIAVNDTNGAGGGYGYLLALNASTLATTGKVRLKDTWFPANDADVDDDGTPSPMVGPDGDVYYGVLENPFGSNHLRGWMLHFSGDLTIRKPAGAFGWDDTASVVPAPMVPSYHGTSIYLIMTKYNNYVEGGGDGVNKVAVLDPNATMSDPVTGATVMKEVLTIAGPTADVPSKRNAAHPNAVREWCINTAAVDPATKSVLVNSEDGHMYRWDLTSNSLSENRLLAPPTAEAYTPTVVGVDGTVYAINDAILCALGR